MVKNQNNKNMKVELINYFGDVQMVAEVARVSYDKSAINYTQEQNNKLIKYLWKHNHTSPFRHLSLQFRITCPIYVERQLAKHQVGISINSISGRYVDFSDTCRTNRLRQRPNAIHGHRCRGRHHWSWCRYVPLL
jgi:thymidylate synthase ThyX